MLLWLLGCKYLGSDFLPSLSQKRTHHLQTSDVISKVRREMRCLSYCNEKAGTNL